MSTRATSPATTRAIVIGVERYGSSRFQDVTAPVNNACGFVSWLLDRAVPKNNITVLAAPLDPGPLDRLIPGSYGLVSAEAVRAAFVGLEGQPGDTLIVYWAGHGYEDGEGGQHLVVPDSEGVSHLAVSRLRAHLLGERIRFDDQLLFVDACRQHHGSLGTTLRAIQFPAALPAVARRQWLLHGAAVGAESALIAAEKTSVFSKYLLGTLRDHPRGEWPPDIPALADILTAQADDRLAPVIVTWADQKGNERTVTTGTPRDDSRTIDRARLNLLLGAIPELDRPKHRKLLARCLAEKFDFQFPSLPAYPTIVELVDVVVRMDPMGCRLREICEERRFDLFFADAPEVRNLKVYLDSLRDPRER